MSNWISTEQELPPVQNGLKHVSEVVEVMCRNGNVIEGFYGFGLKCWVSTDGIIPDRVTHWRPLTEV